MAGYSGTPLAKKLGIKAGHNLVTLGAPDGFVDSLAPLPENVKITSSLAGKTPVDVAVLFVTTLADLRGKFSKVSSRLDSAGGLWVAWPKKASGVKTDVNENLVRDHALEVGLVDNKVCAIDDTWSGLRCVIRVKDRGTKAPSK